jgi:AcrR family transcriptional regulator
MGDAGRGRRRPTCAALIGAFNDIVLRVPYDSIRVADIVARARVGRSSFYEHFSDKDDLLRTTLAAPFSALGALLDESEANAALTHATFLLEHFAGNRHRALAMLRGPPHRHLVRALREQLVGRLRGIVDRRALQATQLAGAMLATLEAWLGGEFDAPAAVLAAELRDVARAFQPLIRPPKR